MRMKIFEDLVLAHYYAQLPAELFSRHSPEPLKNNTLVHVNQSVADLLEIDVKEFERDDIVALLTGVSTKLDYQNIAMCYSGHQFGHFAGRLGDGRAILLAEVHTGKNGKFDLHLKGSGQTLYSRNADGKAVLRSSIREYLCSEAMFHLGIDTTRALCLMASDEPVYREQIETAAMVLRVAPTHVRFGHFEYAYYAQKYDYLRDLANYVIEHHYPELEKNADGYLALLRQAIKKTAKMIAQWQCVGFMHGVMNTDNMSILGLTLDYGPFGFMDAFDAGFICNHSDHEGRYRYENQPEAGLFNISCLAQAFLPILDQNMEQAVVKAKAEINQFQILYEQFYARFMAEKLGFVSVHSKDSGLIDEMFYLMQRDCVDFTIFFRSLSQENNEKNQHVTKALFVQDKRFEEWFLAYQQRIELDALDCVQRSEMMKAVNPKYVLRNYLAEQVIRKAEDEGDFSALDRLMTVLAKPFDEQPEFEIYAAKPPEWSKALSVSCSS